MITYLNWEKQCLKDHKI